MLLTSSTRKGRRQRPIHPNKAVHKPSENTARVCLAKFRATDKITKNPHRSCVFLWGSIFLLFLSRNGDKGKWSQLTLRMTSNSLSLFEVIGRRCPRTCLCLYGQLGRRSGFLFHRRPFYFAFLSLFFWRTLFLCLDVEDSVPHTPCKPSSARLDPALLFVTTFCFGTWFGARNFLLLFCLSSRRDPKSKSHFAQFHPLVPSPIIVKISL